VFEQRWNIGQAQRDTNARKTLSLHHLQGL
jgi:hypothetical protein